MKHKIMKANEAPEKIWVHELAAMELNVPLKAYHVEYVRADAFIDKACAWLKENKDKYLYNTGGRDEYIPTCSSKIIDDFRKYMEE